MPTCRFDPQLNSNQTGLSFISDSQRDEAYLRARPFLLDQKRILLEDGWRCGDRDDSDEVFLDISKPKTATGGNQPRKKKLNKLILPPKFNHFLDMSKASLWREIFENSAIFKARRQGKAKKHDLYMSSSRPLSNILYLLQILAPGMLVISDQYKTANEDVKVSRMLPRANWIRRNKHMLNQVMGNMDALTTAAKDQSIAFHYEMTTRVVTQPHPNTSSQNTVVTQPHSNTSSQNTGALFAAATKRPRYTRLRIITPDYRSDMDVGEGQDWTMCDKDCGWCGRCYLG